MRAEAELEADFPSEAAAEAALASLAVDNEGYLESWVEGATVKARASADDPGSLLATLDDFLACLQVAQGVDAVVTDAEEGA